MSYEWVIVITFFGFVALATILLWPIHKFLNKQETISEEWTEENIKKIKSRKDSDTEDSN